MIFTLGGLSAAGRRSCFMGEGMTGEFAREKKERSTDTFFRAAPLAALASPSEMPCSDDCAMGPCGFCAAVSPDGMSGAWRGSRAVRNLPLSSPHIFLRCPTASTRCAPADSCSRLRRRVIWALPNPTSRGTYIPAAYPPRAGLGQESTGRFAIFLH